MLLEDFISARVCSVSLRFHSNRKCNIPSQRTCVGHIGADLCHQPPHGINHSLRSFSAIKVSTFEEKKNKAFKIPLKPGPVVEKQKLEIYKTNFLAEKL